MSVQASPWYLMRDGARHGPLSDAELAEFRRLGHLRPTDLLWQQSFPEWRPAISVFPPPNRPRQQAAGHISPPPALTVDREDYLRRQQSTHQAPTWPKLLFALICLAAMGAASGYAYEHYSEITELIQTPNQR